ncbi:isoleucine--tRNA ligase [Candidatus Woesearchaeota archaeon]|nr:isoleucine--tRNA ligase [Candidatus Woesearchaeota archaeon]
MQAKGKKTETKIIPAEGKVEERKGIGNYDPIAVEKEILSYWKKHNTYEKARKKNAGKKSFYFLDGPPYTSGRVHIGTAWNKALKDVVLRYKRMQGLDVWDRAGYDMHGLPTEHGVQKKLKLAGKEDILKFGMERFIQECEKFSVENLQQMNEDFIRMGVWMDFENAYQSIKKEFMEGVWWLIKRAHEQKRLYEGLRTIQWCRHCMTALAKHELEYQNVKDESIFLKFKIKGKENEFLVVWTTTPWTIPLNLAVMVNPEIVYVKCKVEKEIWIVAKALAGVFIQGVAGKKFAIVEEMKGGKLQGLEYEHPLAGEIPEFQKLKEKHPKVHTVVLSTEYVDTTAGSGLVHTAPGCGPEDYEIGHREGIAPWNPVDEAGRFPASMGKFRGLIARKDDKEFTKALEEKGAVIAKTFVEHDYPHCQRCHQPVIFRATKQWFFKIEDLKEKMLNANRDIQWVPEAAFNAFDAWLRNLRDNSITKQRFWGTPVPIWRCEQCKEYDVFGSFAELKQVTKKDPKDPHKPWIDEIVYPCKCGGTRRRIPDIVDVWVDAGCVSWTCLDYPQRKEWFEKLYPAEFILEGKDQIRGWFNLLMVASMLAIGKPSFQAAYMHGFVQDALGRKMSKSLGNYILPQEVIDQYGADTLRYYMIGGTTPGIDINYNFEDMKLKYKHLAILWNLHKFLLDYAKTMELLPGTLDENLIRDVFGYEEYYMLSKLNSTVQEVTKLFEHYNLNEVPWKVEKLFLELSRTYIQLVREKSVVGEELEKHAIVYVVYRTLLTCLKLFAPICPFITEKMYLHLREAFGWKEESIHLYPWPKVIAEERDAALEKNMEVAQDIMQAILFGREKMNLGVRWPVKQAVLETSNAEVLKAVQQLGDLITLQTNVKELQIMERLPKVKLSIKPDFAQLGPDFGALAPKIIAKLTIESPETILGHMEKEGFFEMSVNGKKCKIVKEHLIVKKEIPAIYQEVPFKYGAVYVNKERSKELDAEGYARELTRRIQQARKEAGLEKKDRIHLHLAVPEDLQELLEPWKKQMQEKVGATNIIMRKRMTGKHEYTKKEKIKEYDLEIGFERVK